MAKHTAHLKPYLIDLIQLADDIEPNIGECILEQRQEDGNQVLNGRLFPQHWRELHDHSRESCTDVLTAVLGQLPNAR